MIARVLNVARATMGRLPYVTAATAVAAGTAVFLPGRDTFAKGQWAVLYLLIVVLVAGVLGAGPAALAAALSFLAWNFFFLPPYHTFAIHDPDDLLFLLVFLVVGILMGVQTGRLRDRQRRAQAREQETVQLNRLSAYLVSEVSPADAAPTLAESCSRLLGDADVTLFMSTGDGSLRPMGMDRPSDHVARRAEWCFRSARALGLPAIEHDSGGPRWPPTAAWEGGGTPSVNDGETYLPLQTHLAVYGVLRIQRTRLRRPTSSREAHLMIGLANLVGVFLERQHLREQLSRTDALREADRLKAGLLSSVSHELKTPLAGLTATITNLLEGDTEWNEAIVREELRAVVTDVTRLNNSIGALLDLSRLEANAWIPRRDWFDLSDIVAAGLACLPAHRRRGIVVRLPDDLEPLYVDFQQWTRVFQHLLENAVLYAGEGGTITVGGRQKPGGVLMWVKDCGPGVPVGEREAIFEKFHRGAQRGKAGPSGTGLGLAITREIVMMNGGSIHVEEVHPHGARFVISLPSGTEGQLA